MSEGTLTSLLTSLHELVDTLGLPQREEAAVRDLLGRLTDRVGAVAGLCGEAERGALRWSPALPVPEWARRVRSVVGGAPWTRDDVQVRRARRAQREQEPAVESVGALVERAVRQRGISLSEAARRSGYSPPAVASWARGDRQPAAAALLDFLRQLGYSPAVVLDGASLLVDVTAGEALRRAGWTAPTT